MSGMARNPAVVPPGYVGQIENVEVRSMTTDNGPHRTVIHDEEVLQDD
jgi:hypothetical protein